MREKRAILLTSCITLFLVATPLAAEAMGYARPTSFKELVAIFLDLISRLVPLVFALALTVLVWGMVKAWILQGDERSIEDGKHKALIGVIVFAAMSGIWGIIALLQSSFLG